MDAWTNETKSVWKDQVQSRVEEAQKFSVEVKKVQVKKRNERARIMSLIRSFHL